MDIGIEGKVALVVGGARGIGAAAAAMLAREGARVAVADLDGAGAEASAARIGASAIGIAMDVNSPASVGAGTAAVSKRLGGIDILVHSAAVVDDKLFMESGIADWKRMLDVCLTGPMLTIHSVLPGMVERGYGRVVCLASDSARVGQARLSYYAAAKGGVVALVKSIAQEVGRHGVMLNVVSPGATNTELRNDREAALRAQMGEEKYQRRVKSVLKMYPAGRLGEPDDIAAAIVFLASARAAWITGQVLSVNGGFVMP